MRTQHEGAAVVVLARSTPPAERFHGRRLGACCAILAGDRGLLRNHALNAQVGGMLAAGLFDSRQPCALAPKGMGAGLPVTAFGP